MTISSKESGLLHMQYIVMAMVCGVGLLGIAFFVRGNRESLPFSKHLMRCALILASSNTRESTLSFIAAWYAAAMLNSPQLLAPSCCWRATTEINSPLHWINGLYTCAIWSSVLGESVPLKQLSYKYSSPLNREVAIQCCRSSTKKICTAARVQVKLS